MKTYSCMKVSDQRVHYKCVSENSLTLPITMQNHRGSQRIIHDWALDKESRWEYSQQAYRHTSLY